MWMARSGRWVMFAVENWKPGPPPAIEVAKWLDESLQRIVALTEDDTGTPSKHARREGPPSVSEARLTAFGEALWAVYDMHQIWHSLGPRTGTVIKAPAITIPAPVAAAKYKVLRRDALPAALTDAGARWRSPGRPQADCAAAPAHLAHLVLGGSSRNSMYLGPLEAGQVVVGRRPALRSGGSSFTMNTLMVSPDLASARPRGALHHARAQRDDVFQLVGKHVEARDDDHVPLRSTILV